MFLSKGFLQRLLLFAIILCFQSGACAANTVIELFINGKIDPATAIYVSSEITQAQKTALIILNITSQGGLNKSVDTIKKAISESKVPIITYVEKSTQVENNAIELLKVSTLVAITPQVVLPKNTKINTIVVKNKEELLPKLHGMIVLQDGLKIQLDTHSLNPEKIFPSWKIKLLATITEPTVVYLLFILGLYGIYFGIICPGLVTAGVLGTIILCVAFYSMQFLLIDYSGIALICIGITLIVTQAFSNRFGLWGIAGTLGFIMGSFMCMPITDADFQICRFVIWTLSAVNILVLFTLLSLMKESGKRRSRLAYLVGAEGRAIEEISPCGKAVIRGEIWNVHTEESIAANARIKVVATEGMKLTVQEMVERRYPAAN